MGKYTERIARGAALLDEHRPGWRKRVDLAALDLGSCSRCVLGQLLGDYDHRAELGLDDETDVEAIEHGFALSFEEERAIHGDGLMPSSEVYAGLTGAWREYIRETRQAVAS